MNWPLIIGCSAGVTVAIAFPVAVVLGLHWLLGAAEDINALDGGI